jgi:anti-sigma factor RsiW
MNEMIQPRPCADYEHEIVELLEGSLGPEQASMIRGHLDACPRCRTWQAEFASLDARLASALPQPQLSPDFAANLRERLATLARPMERGNLRAAADAEYQRTVASLRRGARRSASLDAIAAVGVAACAIALARSPLLEANALLSVFAGSGRLAAFGALGAAVALGALAWSAMRGGLPVFRLRA